LSRWSRRRQSQKTAWTREVSSSGFGIAVGYGLELVSQ